MQSFLEGDHAIYLIEETRNEVLQFATDKITIGYNELAWEIVTVVCIYLLSLFYFSFAIFSIHKLVSQTSLLTIVGKKIIIFNATYKAGC